MNFHEIYVHNIKRYKKDPKKNRMKTRTPTITYQPTDVNPVEKTLATIPESGLPMFVHILLSIGSKFIPGVIGKYIPMIKV
jgi:hypothetical protein